MQPVTRHSQIHTSATSATDYSGTWHACQDSKPPKGSSGSLPVLALAPLFLVSTSVVSRESEKQFSNGNSRCTNDRLVTGLF